MSYPTTRNAAFLLCVSLCSVLETSAQSPPGRAITLQPFVGSNAVDVTRTKTVRGSCGGMFVNVFGVTEERSTSFETDVDAGKLIVGRATPQGMPKEVNLSALLNDLNGLACVATNSGVKLLVWSNCNGRVCDEYSFAVVDPKTLKIISPKVCGTACAVGIVGISAMPRVN